MLRIAGERREFGREIFRDFRRVGQPQIFIGLQPSQAVAYEHAAPDIPAEVGAGAMGGRSQKADRRAGFAFGICGRAGILFGHADDAMASPIDFGRAIVLRERRQGPEDIHQIFLATVRPAPHVLVAVWELPHFAGVDLDRLREVELDAVASRSEDRLHGGQDDGIEHQIGHGPRAPQQAAEPFRSPAVEIAFTKGRLGEDRVEILCKGMDSRRRRSMQDAIAVAPELADEAACKSGILVKPTRPDIVTNIVINTSRRTYHIELRATPATYMASVSWSYPEAELIALRMAEAERERTAPVAAGLDLGALNFRYRVSGDKPGWRPVRVFDDGRQTFVEFGDDIATGEMPPLFATGAKGEAELLNYRVQGRYMIVDRLFERGELRMGAGRAARKVIIERAPRGGGRS